MGMTSEQIKKHYMAGIDTAACEWHLLLMFNPGRAKDFKIQCGIPVEWGGRIVSSPPPRI